MGVNHFLVSIYNFALLHDATVIQHFNIAWFLWFISTLNHLGFFLLLLLFQFDFLKDALSMEAILHSRQKGGVEFANILLLSNLYRISIIVHDRLQH